MALEYFWRNDQTAKDFQETAKAAVVAAPPQTTGDGSHTLGHHAVGGVARLDGNNDATGYYVAVNLSTGEALIYTHHSPHESARPSRDGTFDCGQYDTSSLVVLCYPARPVVYAVGIKGLVNKEIDPDQLNRG